MVSRLNLLAGLLCLGGVAVLGILYGQASITGGLGQTVFAGGLALAGCLFLLAATERTTALAGRRVDLQDCSGLGDIAVGVAVFGGFATAPAGVEGVAYIVLVGIGGLSAVLFGLVGLAEKYDAL